MSQFNLSPELQRLVDSVRETATAMTETTDMTFAQCVEETLAAYCEDEFTLEAEQNANAVWAVLVDPSTAQE